MGWMRGEHSGLICFSSFYGTGALFGGIFGGFFLQYGRRRVLTVMSLPFSLSWIITVFAKSVTTMFATAFLGGFCCSIVSMVTQVRGKEKLLEDVWPFYTVNYAISLSLEWFCNILISFRCVPPFLFTRVGVHKWNCFARCAGIFIGHSEDCRPFGRTGVVFVGGLFGLASIGNARIDCSDVTFLDCDLYTRNAKLFSVKWSRRWSIQVNRILTYYSMAFDCTLHSVLLDRHTTQIHDA